MSKEIGILFFDFQCLCILLSFLVSISIGQRKGLPKYMKNFFWYPTVGILITIPIFVSAHFPQILEPSVRIINNISLLFHYSFLSFFIIRVTPQRNNQILHKLIFCVFLFLLIYFLAITNNKLRNHIAFGVSNFGLLIFCMTYYYRILNNVPNLILLNDPSFWIVNGVFFSMGVNLPFFFSMGYVDNFISSEIYQALAAMPRICYGIMHLFFIKAYLCAIQNLKV